MSDIVVIGGGILGVSLSYFLSSSTNCKVSLVEQHDIASHTSTRNTGKVHAPFLYDPDKKKIFARAAFLGFKMWKEYCELNSLPFRQDGVLEVATYDKGIDRLHKYVKWGYANGLHESEIKFLEEKQVAQIEPNVRCLAAIYCSRDGSVNYRLITKKLAQDASEMGCKIMTGVRVSRIEQQNGHVVMNTDDGSKISADYVINAAGGNAVDIAHSMGVASEYMDLHFRGEYWQAPEEYRGMTKISVYSVPKYPDYPFLDPHWIVRADGRREIGPNAVPVFSPYGYNLKENMKSFLPKVREIIGSGARKIWMDRQFLSLAFNELRSSLSKTAMVERAQEFLPQLDPSHFKIRGTAGVRSSLIDRNGKFVPDTMFFWKEHSLHILNYNSPGATGALPIAAMITDKMLQDGIVSRTKPRSLWDIQSVSQFMTSS